MGMKMGIGMRVVNKRKNVAVSTGTILFDVQ